MDLSDIPQGRTACLPPGVTEVKFPTIAEMNAFLLGLHYAGGADVESGPPFVRDGGHVVRVRVGDFGDGDNEYDEYD